MTLQRTCPECGNAIAATAIEPPLSTTQRVIRTLLITSYIAAYGLSLAAVRLWVCRPALSRGYRRELAANFMEVAIAIAVPAVLGTFVWMLMQPRSRTRWWVMAAVTLIVLNAGILLLRPAFGCS